MSMRALKKAVETHLRDLTRLNDPRGAFVKRSIKGQPDPLAGQKWVGIDGNGFTNQDQNPLGLDETYGVLVVVTFRVGYAPADRRASELTIDEHVDDLVDRIRVYLHGSYDVMNAANEEIGDGANGFIEPLRFVSASAPIEKGPDWFWSEGADEKAASGIAVELKFGGARRVQLFAEAT